MYKNKDHYKEQRRKYLIENWIFCLLLIIVILGAGAFSEWAASLLETFFQHIGVL